jgi:hypothetical protein
MNATYAAFGLAIDSNRELPLTPDAGRAGHPVELEHLGADAVSERWSGSAQRTWTTRFGGERVVAVDRGHAGDQRIDYGGRATFHVAPDGSRLAWAGDPADPATLRFLLDTALWWTALTRGHHLLHASAISFEGATAAFVSQMGGGKTTLAGELLRRGGALFSDDVVALDHRDGLIAHPGPPLMNVPLTRPELVALGEKLAVIEEGDAEAWVRLDREAIESAPLSHLFLYRRVDGASLEVTRSPLSVLELMPFAWGLPDDRRAARDRFEAMADLAETVKAYVLTASLDDPPSAIADAVTSTLKTG